MEEVEMVMADSKKQNIIQIVKDYSNRLFGFIRGKVNTDEDAEDILQDVWYQLTDTSASETIEQVSGWLFAVARNKITDKYRKKKPELLDVPRMYDYHPQSIPALYNHSNIDSDEVLYYVDGDFMSRKQVTRGMITLHPGGIPHGPYPGTVEKSIGVRDTKELAVMVDTFHALMLTVQALEIEIKGYTESWID